MDTCIPLSSTRFSRISGMALSLRVPPIHNPLDDDLVDWILSPGLEAEARHLLDGVKAGESHHRLERRRGWSPPNVFSKGGEFRNRHVLDLFQTRVINLGDDCRARVGHNGAD